MTPGARLKIGTPIHKKLSLVFCFLFMGKSEWIPISLVNFWRNENPNKNDAPVEIDALCRRTYHTYLGTALQTGTRLRVDDQKLRLPNLS